MEKRQIIGLALIFLGIVFVIDSYSGITGFAVNETIGEDFGTVFGLVFIAVGAFLFLAREEKEGNLARKIIASGTIITNPKKLKRIALDMGLRIEEGRKEGYVVYKGGEPLTTIPRHISKGTYYSIMKALATGESNLRRRYGRP